MVTPIWRPSPNYSRRPEGTKIDAIVLHADAGKSEAGTVAWLQRTDSKVSYHYLIGRAGVLYQFVEERHRAWHAGVSTFKGRAFCNNYSLGVSFANDQKGEPFPKIQIAAGVALVAQLCNRHAIQVDRITTHAVVSPGRKSDPGKLFPFEAFIEQVVDALDALTNPERQPVV